MPKAKRVLASLLRDGWVEIHRTGSHRTLEKGGVRITWAFHDGDDLGKIQMAQIARQYGYTLEKLRRL